jgi:hypothetical protein
VSSTGAQWISADVTNYVNSWASGVWANNGLMIDSGGRAGYGRLAAVAQPGWSPYLHITYQDTSPPVTSLTEPSNGAVVATATPTLAASAVSDPDPGDSVQYDFQVGTGTANGAVTGEVADSGWTPPGVNTWAVPAGFLRNGGTYDVQVFTSDGQAPPLGGAVTSFKVNQRLGDDPLTARDSVGAASVNMGTGNATVSVATRAVSTVGGPISVGLQYDSQGAASVHGLSGAYVAGCNGSNSYNPANVFAGWGPATVTRLDPSPWLNFGLAGPFPSGVGVDWTQNYCVRWTGFITATPGTYTLQVNSDDGVAVYLDNNYSAPVQFVDSNNNPVNLWNDHGLASTPYLS